MKFANTNGFEHIVDIKFSEYDFHKQSLLNLKSFIEYQTGRWIDQRIKIENDIVTFQLEE